MSPARHHVVIVARESGGIIDAVRGVAAPMARRTIRMARTATMVAIRATMSFRLVGACFAGRPVRGLPLLPRGAGGALLARAVRIRIFTRW